jgi:hypothetical protein
LDVARVDEDHPQAEFQCPPLRISSPGVIRPTDPSEAQLKRRAKRRGLGLMIASSIVSLLVLYGAWVLLRL